MTDINLERAIFRVEFVAKVTTGLTAIVLGDTDLERSIVCVELVAVVVQEERPAFEPVVRSAWTHTVVAVSNYQSVTCTKKRPL